MNTFIPVKTYQGLTSSEIIELIGEREIYIWGAGHLGQVIRRRFDRIGLAVNSFCDSNPKYQNHTIDNLKVIQPKEAFSAAHRKKGFVIIASARFKDEMEKECTGAGLVKTEDFLTYFQLSRPEAAIDVSGRCNLACPSCPRGNMDDLRPEGYMTASTYEQVLNKLLCELPHLMHIDLATWGEPLMNPEIAAIVRMTEKLVPCSIHTNLQISDYLEDVIKAQPSQIIISISGYGETYEKSHAGASWPTLVANLHLVREHIARLRPKTRFSVLYHLYRNNHQDFDLVRELCSQLGLPIHAAWAYLNPYDRLLDYCEGRHMGEQAMKVLDLLSWDIDHVLKLTKTENCKPCLCQRIFPIINWDLSVALCHTFYHPIIADNFLDVSLDELVNARQTQQQCRTCQMHGLHRLDIDVLTKRYPDIRLFKTGLKGAATC